MHLQSQKQGNMGEMVGSFFCDYTMMYCEYSMISFFSLVAYSVEIIFKNSTVFQAAHVCTVYPSSHYSSQWHSGFSDSQKINRNLLHSKLWFEQRQVGGRKVHYKLHTMFVNIQPADKMNALTGPTHLSQDPLRQGVSRHF